MVYKRNLLPEEIEYAMSTTNVCLDLSEKRSIREKGCRGHRAGARRLPERKTSTDSFEH